jgi:hypothetical protein
MYKGSLQKQVHRLLVKRVSTKAKSFNINQIIKHFIICNTILPAHIRSCLVMHLEGGSDSQEVPIKLHSSSVRVADRLNGPLMPAMLSEWAGNLD